MRTARALFTLGLIVAGWAGPQILAFAQVPERPAAVVNGEPIGMTEVKAVLDQRPSPVPLTAAQQKELRHAALDMLVEDMLMRQFLRKAGGAPHPGTIEKEIDELKVVLKKQGKNLDIFLREASQTEAQLRADVQARLQWKSFLHSRIPDAEIKTYYEANKLLFDKVQVRASHLLVKVASAADAKEKSLARARLETLQQEILTGRLDFADAAKRYSECPSKDKGGDIGQFPWKFVVVEPFSRAAFALKVGQVSDIVASDFGFHLIKVTDRTPGEPSTFDTARDSIRDIIAQEQDLFPRILAEQRKTAKIEVLMP